MRVIVAALCLTCVQFIGDGVAFADELTPAFLVRAKVKSVQAHPNGKSGTAVLEILHVYAEDQKRKGETFTDQFNVGPDARGFAAGTAFEVDEVGLWVVTVTRKGTLGITSDPTLPFRWRSRKVDTPRYAEHVKLAEAIESVLTADERKQGKMLVGLAGSDSPEIATWAVWKLGESEDFAADKFLNGFVTKPDVKMPLRAQVAMDEVLTKVRREDWYESKSRAAMLTAWAGGKVEECDGSRLLNYLINAFEREDLDNELACEVVALAINNKEWPLTTRTFAAQQLAQLGRRPDDSVAVDRLVKTVQGVADKDLRSAAAAAIRRYVKLDDKQEAALRDAEDRRK